MLFPIWYMVAVFPMLAIMHGVERLNAWLGKRGRKVDGLYIILILLVVLFLILLSAGYKL